MWTEWFGTQRWPIRYLAVKRIESRAGELNNGSNGQVMYWFRIGIEYLDPGHDKHPLQHTLEPPGEVALAVASLLFGAL